MNPQTDDGDNSDNNNPPPGRASGAHVEPVRWMLPFRKRWPLLAGALLGVLLRLVFSGKPGGVFSAMSGAFIYLVPVVVSAVTVYLAETTQRRSWAYYFVAGATANLFFVLGTLLIMIEGLVCAIIILPLFMLQGGVVGLLMGALCRWAKWPPQAVGGFAALPILLAGLVPHAPAEPVISTLERTLPVAAAPAQIWQQLMNTPNIQPGEVGAAWLYKIGVPLPESGVTRTTAEGLVRSVVMGKAIHFEQTSADWRENQHVRWAYRFAKDSFPPDSLDDHVMIGGRYFDIIDTTYTLTPLDTATTELRVQFRYRVSTDFNWYSGAVARLLIGNFEEVILGFYRQRAEVAGLVR